MMQHRVLSLIVLVAVAPGTGFSEEGEGYLRLALVENEARLRQAVRKMKKAMENMDV
jgi:alanine-synthesizing transaminase